MAPRALDPREAYIPILTYHQVDGDHVPLPEGNYARDYTRLSDFVAQMQFLAAQGFAAVTHEDLYAWLMGQASLPDRPVAITFDDGRLSVLENAFPVLQALGWRASVYVITALAGGEPARGHALDVPSMTWDQLKVLRDAGWTIGSHTRNHWLLKDMPAGEGREARLLEEYEGARDDIERRLGITPLCFAYPGGQWNWQAERLAARVYRTARVWTWRGRADYCTQGTPPYRLPSMNISFHWPFTDFQRFVQRTQPSYYYQQDLDWYGRPRGGVLHRARLFLGRAARRALASTSQVDQKTHV